ncbi:MAG: protein kinase [Planctomycetota bacterium]|nr:protein kinase [Planctomycetota bacterium]
MAKIMAVDAERDLITLLQKLVESEGDTFVSVTTGRAAIADFNKVKPDLILLDLILPDISGMQVCDKIRSVSNTPIIILSALRDKGRIVEAYERGANDYLPKPVEPGELLAKIKVQLARSTGPHQPLGSPEQARGLESPRPFGDFVIEALLGHGGVGTVYRAHPEGRPERKIAIKCLAPELSSNQKYVTRFLREAKYAHAVEDPCIVKVFEAGHHHGTYFYAMELVEGSSFSEYVKQRKELDILRVLLIIGDILNALAAVYEAGFIHRDVSAKNIMLDEKSGCAKLADFGIAKRSQGDETTTTSVMVGTPHFMAPEVIEGRDPDIRSDLYSLGICLYFGIVGKYPFKGDKMQLMFQHTSKPMVIPDSVPEDIARYVSHLTDKAPEGRPNHPGIAMMELTKVIENHIRKQRAE